ncbi:MAG TPA: CDP-6-deoxy-delta-3,4-glucoseen reductase [Novimethylophilus sp.]|jgi:CDP-4-dehydro-6-deoxyglucose reductase|uniref:CDP-6-deoxy-delta-3,4-glucoseen reductase n=1 Tax=Novimethylophilus sp. TaxID=2137426 RepID=UPI002F3F4644
MSFQITIQPSGHVFSAPSDDTILNAALEAGYTLPYGCRNGGCGACKGQVLEGAVDYGDAQSHVLSDAEKSAGKALFCCARPLSDVTIECREVGLKGGIQTKILPCRVERKVQLAPDVIAMHLKLPANERLQFLPGQYIEFLLKDGGRRAFSLANAPFDDQMLELHARLIPGGKFTEYAFKEMSEKAILRFEGPMGTFTLREESDKPIIFVAGGTGFAPIKGIIEHMFHHRIRRDMVLYWGALARQDLYMPELPEQWAAEHDNFRFIPVLSQPGADDAWTGRTGLVHQAVLADGLELKDYQVYCCGAPAMVEAAHRDFTAQGLPEGEFFSDAFTFAPKK